MKDTLFCALVALFVMLSADIIKSREQIKHSKLLAFFGVSLLLCLFRNNGVYMVLPAVVVLFFAVSGVRSKLQIACVAVTVLSVFTIWNSLIMPALGIIPGSNREALSIPIQQTARFVIEHPNEVTEEERAVIDEVLDYEKIPELYNPELSDPVKFSRHTEVGKEYLQAWRQMFSRHPETYIQATLHGIYGYVYPFSNEYAQSGYYNWIQGEPIAWGELDIHFVNSEKTIAKLDAYNELWRDAPILSLTSSAGAHAWVLLVLIVMLLRKKRLRELAVMILPLLNLGICVASPVNGCLRYAMPLMACVPFLVAYASSKSRERMPHEALAVSLSSSSASTPL